MRIPDVFNVIKGRIARNRIVGGAFPLLLLLSGTGSIAQISPPLPPATGALAGSATARTGPGIAAISNPAAVDFETPPSVELFVTPSPLGLQGVVESAVVAALPLSHDLYSGMTLSAYGEPHYLESSISSSLSLRLTDRFSAGVRLALHTTAVDGYRTRYSTSADIGALAAISENLRVGVAVVNALRPQPVASTIPPTMRLGVAADLDSVSILSIDMIQELGREPSLAAGLTHALSPELLLLCGMATEPFTLGFGGRLMFGEMSVELSSAWLHTTGLRHTFGVGLHW